MTRQIELCDKQVLTNLLNLLFQIEVEVARNTVSNSNNVPSPFFCALDNTVCSLIHFACVREETKEATLGAITREHFSSLLETMTPPRSQCVALLVSIDDNFRALFLEYLSSANSPFKRRVEVEGDEMDVDSAEEEGEAEEGGKGGKGLEEKVGDGVFVSQVLLLPILVCAYGGERKRERRGKDEEELLSSIIEFMFSCGGLFVPPSSSPLLSSSDFTPCLYHSFGGGAFSSFHNVSFRSSLLCKRVQSRVLSSSPVLLSSQPLSPAAPLLSQPHPPLDFLSYYLSSFLLPAIDALSPSSSGVTFPKKTTKNLLKFFENQAQSLPFTPSLSPPLPSYFLPLYSRLLFSCPPTLSSSSSSPLLPPKNKKEGLVVASSTHLLSFISFCLKTFEHQVTSLHKVNAEGGVIESLKYCLQMVMGSEEKKGKVVGKIVGRLVDGEKGEVAGLGGLVEKLVGGGDGVERKILVELCEFFEILFEMVDGPSSSSSGSKKRKLSKESEKDRGMEKKKTKMCVSLCRTLLSVSALSLYFPSLSEQKEGTKHDQHDTRQEALLSLLGFLLSHCPPPPTPPTNSSTTTTITTMDNTTKPLFDEPQTDEVFTQEAFSAVSSLFSGTMSGCDAIVSGLLYLFELRGFTVGRCGGGMGGVLSFASSSSSSSGSSLVGASSIAPSGNLLVTMLFQSSLDQHKLYDSLRHFPVSFTSPTHGKLSSPSESNPTTCDRFTSSYHYSPLFLVPLLEYAVSVDRQLDCSQFVTQNGLGYCVVATSSDSPQIRELAYSALSRYDTF